MYVQTLREFVPGIRKGYPGARIIALGQKSCFSPDGGDTGWRSIVLDQAEPELYDLIDVHSYSGVPHDAKGPARQDALVNAADNLSRVVSSAAEDLAARGLDKLGKTVAITEWNLWHTACHHDGKGFCEQYDVEHGLFTALTLNHWMRMGDKLELANFYNLLNVMGIIISKGSRFEETCVVDVFKLYRQALPGTVVPVDVQGPVIDGGVSPAVDAVCIKGASTHVFLINRDAQCAVEFQLPAELGRPVQVLTLSGKTSADAALVATSGVASPDRGIALPPLSITRVEFK
jgi:alpha-L-arabinofuranosidase